MAFDPARELADYRRRAFEAWPHIDVTDVDSTGLPDTPVLGSKLTLTATVQLAGLRPDEVTVQAVVGRVDTGDALVDPVTVEMPYTGTAAGGDHIFATTTPLPVAGFSRLHRAGVAASSDAGLGGRVGSGHAGFSPLTVRAGTGASETAGNQPSSIGSTPRAPACASVVGQNGGSEARR